MSDDIKARLLNAARKADADADAKKLADARRLSAQQQEEQDRFNRRAETLERLFGPVLTAALDAYAELPVPFFRKDNLDYTKSGKYDAPNIEFGFGQDVVKAAIYSKLSISSPGKHEGDTWWDRTAEFGMQDEAAISEEKILNLIEHLLRQHKGLEKRYQF